ncbi:hypothetical protein ATPR_2581 [Acetobacter tropicalis NBRC 101654]|uniref:Uncharacterized protein n=1 Tax=Acetobacter tropicalis NBRC 101654 TaxID=749388 RepID=F7VGT2_9PROT|nr:hypothetical protein ATPR_2581 [Acetobacter tropicalis NBRC 101654]
MGWKTGCRMVARFFYGQILSFHLHGFTPTEPAKARCAFALQQEQ